MTQSVTQCRREALSWALFGVGNVTHREYRRWSNRLLSSYVDELRGGEEVLLSRMESVSWSAGLRVGGRATAGKRLCIEHVRRSRHLQEPVYFQHAGRRGSQKETP